MTDMSLSTAAPVVRHGFILLHETFCEGLIPAESDGRSQVIIYETRAEAESELADAAALRADAMIAAKMEASDDDEDRWVESVVLHSDGTLALVDQALVFTADALRELWR